MASSTPGQTLPNLGCSASAMPEAAAPMRKPPSAVCSIALISAIFLMSTIRPGRTAPERICTNRSVPPARMRAALPAAANAPIASSSVCGATYRISVMLVTRLPCPLSGRFLPVSAWRGGSLHKPGRLEQPPGTGQFGRLLCRDGACDTVRHLSPAAARGRIASLDAIRVRGISESTVPRGSAYPGTHARTRGDGSTHRPTAFGAAPPRTGPHPPRHYRRAARCACARAAGRHRYRRTPAPRSARPACRR